jgi:hypothetical protein
MQRHAIKLHALGATPLAYGQLRLGVQPIHPLVVDDLALGAQQVGDAPVAEASSLVGQGHDALA